MQNTPQTFRGAGAPNVNFSGHAYDNHLGAHCGPTNYQPYPNTPYHTARPHHYGNHHPMQQQPNVPYRHQGGAYGSNQNQYGMNQYNQYNNRNMPTKPWSDNGADMMSPYGHSQVINPPNQLPVNSLRSPPHTTSNMNQQHFNRQMQSSPAHSPHSWSQVPSPNLMQSARSMHSQQGFPLPPQPTENGQMMNPAVSMESSLHTSMQQPQENGQMMNPASAPENSLQPSPENGPMLNPSATSDGPLHSLQKMVMLEQKDSSSKVIMLPAEDHFSSQNFVPEQESSTYYNMDENRFESQVKHNSPAGCDNASTSTFSNVLSPQLMSNHDFPLQSPEEMKSVPVVCASSVCSTSPSGSNVAAISTAAKPADLIRDVFSMECPPHAESAPVFTDQIEAAISTNSEQALEAAMPNLDCLNMDSKNLLCKSTNNSLNDEMCGLNNSDDIHVKSENQYDDRNSNVTANLNLSLKLESTKTSSPQKTAPLEEQVSDLKIKEMGSESTLSAGESLSKNSNCEPLLKTEVPDTLDSIEKENMNLKSDSLPESDIKKEINSSTNPDNDSKTSSVANQDFISKDVKKEKESQSSSLIAKAKDIIKHNPVKVVIHRIRKNETDSTWHVPRDSSVKEDSDTKLPAVGPQIVILSPSAPTKKFGFSSSVAADNVITIDDEDDSSNERKPSKPATRRSSPDKKRGRPVGSKNRSPPTKQKRKGKKGTLSKKKKDEKEPLAKPAKKTKSFSGPYVHIVGNQKNPSSIKVVNVAQKEEEKISKLQQQPKRTPIANRKRPLVGHLSTLSPTYDAFNRDKTWLCAFCHKGSHMIGLGDLYGPYYIKDKDCLLKSPASSHSGSVRGGKRRKSDQDEGHGSKRAKQTPSTEKSLPKHEETELCEVWIHEDCAIWCQSISLLGEEVRGLEEAVLEAADHTCCKCKCSGATLGCWGKGCKEQYHFICAKDTGCQMDIENFSLLCPKHQKPCH